MLEYWKFTELFIYSANIFWMSTLCQVLLDTGNVVKKKQKQSKVPASRVK